MNAAANRTESCGIGLVDLDITRLQNCDRFGKPLAFNLKHCDFGAVVLHLFACIGGNCPAAG
jgi:hypothetical protein